MSVKVGVLGRNIKHLRLAKGLSQTRFAEQVGLNRGNIASYEAGAAEPSATKLLEIAQYFGISLEQLIEVDCATMDEIREAIPSYGLGDDEKLEYFQEQYKGIEEIVRGIASYSAFRISRMNEITPELKELALTYERLINLFEDFLKINVELMDYTESLRKRIP